MVGLTATQAIKDELGEVVETEVRVYVVVQRQQGGSRWCGKGEKACGFRD